MCNLSNGTFVGFLLNGGQDKLVQLWFKSRPQDSNESVIRAQFRSPQPACGALLYQNCLLPLRLNFHRGMLSLGRRDI